jgi:predicted NBD/HSP70 family sugar kinase
MSDDLIRVKPKIVPPLDDTFRPFYLALREMEKAAKATGKAEPLAFALEWAADSVSVFRTLALPADHPQAKLNLEYAERILKFLLWQRGGYKVSVAGPKGVAEHLSKLYSGQGTRQFDYDFMGKVYEAKFQVVAVAEKDLPKATETSKPVGRHLSGCRIGFDAGGSDRKVAAVIDGKEVFSTETVWHPKTTSDPQYHIDGINDSIEQAMKHMPRLDAIGVSSAGIYVNNRCMVASLFRKVPEDQFNAKIKDIYLNVAKKWGNVPIEVANDGDVTALAGSMSLEENSVLGIAMGTSMAVGYVDDAGHITGWLNELAFAPIDLSKDSPQDTEWSGDYGTGVNYFSQDAVIRLAPKIGFKFKEESPGEKLKEAQDAFKAGNKDIAKIYETIGVYLGYAILHFSYFYDIKHVLILGRVTSGNGGDIILEKARATMQAEDPKLAKSISVNLPDEKMRRVGQSIAAASLPALK